MKSYTFMVNSLLFTKIKRENNLLTRLAQNNRYNMILNIGQLKYK